MSKTRRSSSRRANGPEAALAPAAPPALDPPHLRTWVVTLATGAEETVTAQTFDTVDGVAAFHNIEDLQFIGEPPNLAPLESTYMVRSFAKGHWAHVRLSPEPPAEPVA